MISFLMILFIAGSQLYRAVLYSSTVCVHTVHTYSTYGGYPHSKNKGEERGCTVKYSGTKKQKMEEIPWAGGINQFDNI